MRNAPSREGRTATRSEIAAERDLTDRLLRHLDRRQSARIHELADALDTDVRSIVAQCSYLWKYGKVCLDGCAADDLTVVSRTDPEPRCA